MYAKLPLLLLLSAGLASVSTAFAPHHDARSINIVPRQVWLHEPHIFLLQGWELTGA